jgi:hypothetical protein
MIIKINNKRIVVYKLGIALQQIYSTRGKDTNADCKEAQKDQEAPDSGHHGAMMLYETIELICLHCVRFVANFYKTISTTATGEEQLLFGINDIDIRQ